MLQGPEGGAVSEAGRGDGGPAGPAERGQRLGLRRGAPGQCGELRLRLLRGDGERRDEDRAGAGGGLRRPLVLERLRHRGPQHEADRREVVPGDVEDQLEQVAGELRLGVEQALDRSDSGDLRLIRESHDVADIAAAPQRDQDSLAEADRAAQVLRDAELQRFGEREAQRDVGIADGHGSTIVS